MAGHEETELTGQTSTPDQPRVDWKGLVFGLIVLAVVVLIALWPKEHPPINTAPVHVQIVEMFGVAPDDKHGPTRWRVTMTVTNEGATTIEDWHAWLTVFDKQQTAITQAKLHLAQLKPQAPTVLIVDVEGFTLEQLGKWHVDNASSMDAKATARIRSAEDQQKLLGDLAKYDQALTVMKSRMEALKAIKEPSKETRKELALQEKMFPRIKAKREETARIIEAGKAD